MVLVAHISDPHLDGGEARDARLRAVMATLATMRGLDAIVVSGDISNDATPAGYRRAKELLAAEVPVFCCPGNVDERDAFRVVLVGDDAPAGAPVNQRHDTDAATYLLCDSTIPGDVPGRLADATLDWLRAQLADVAADRMVFLVMHQPPVSLDPARTAQLGLTNANALAGLLAERPVAAILVGHFHWPSTATFAGIPMRMSGAVAADLHGALPWEPERPTDSPAPDPVVSFHLLGDDGMLQTAYRAVPIS